MVFNTKFALFEEENVALSLPIMSETLFIQYKKQLEDYNTNDYNCITGSQFIFHIYLYVI